MLRLLLEHYLIQLLFTVGVVVLTGFTVAVTKRLLLKCCGSGAYCVEVVTGVIGTPIHELSHAFFCLLFGHRITGIRLWSPKAEDGDLGYVSHSYREGNLWQQIGNFFIGIAPILGGSAVLFLLLWLLVPETAGMILDAARPAPPSDIAAVPRELLLQAWVVLKSLFSPKNFTRWDFYLYLLLAILIVLHMEISGSDLKSGLWGFSFVATLLLLLDTVLAIWFPQHIFQVTSVAVSLGAFLGSFFCLALCIDAVLLVIGLITLAVRRRQ